MPCQKIWNLKFNQFSILVQIRSYMVYIHSDSERKLPQNFDAACALYGAIESALDVRLTTIEEVAMGKFDTLIKKHLFVGSVEFMLTVFTRVGLTVPPLNYLMDTYVQTTIADIRKSVERGQTWFVKPLHTKLFTGMVFNDATISQLSSYPDDVQILIAKPFESSILNETRCYVNNGRIIDARNYAGDFRISPDWNWIDTYLVSLNQTPSAFSIDVGVLENGRNVIIEYNDMWAIGNYGLENTEYFRLLSDRYFEIMTTM